MPVQKRVRANAGYDEQRRKCHEAKKSDRDVGTGAARRQWQLFLNRLEPARVGPSDIVGLLHFIAEADKRFADRLGIVDRLFQLLLFGKIVRRNRCQPRRRRASRRALRGWLRAQAGRTQRRQRECGPLLPPRRAPAIGRR